MTISATGRRYSYTGNGVTVDFSFPRPFAANPDLKVYLVVIATGVATLQTYATHYTVAGAGLDAGGTVTMLVAPTAAEKVVIFADTDATQNLDLDAVTSWPMSSVEYAFDRLTIMVQEIWDRMSRTLHAPREWINTFDYQLPVPQASYYLGVNAAGTAFEMRNPVGNTWIVGAGVPALGTGVTGDMYIDTSTGDVYGPKAATWGSAVLNIMGPPGASGAGDVTGPASSVLNRIAVFADTTGKLLADGGALISDLLAKAGGTMTGLLVTVASASGGAGLRIPHGVAPSSPTNGDIWTTTADLLYRINGVTYKSMDLEGAQTLTGIKTFPASTTGGPALKIPAGVAPSAPSDGDVWATASGMYYRASGVTQGPFAAAGAAGAYPPGHIFGLTMSNAAGDTTNDITIEAGSVRSDDDTTNIVLAAAITKQIDAAWAVGTNAGGMNTGSVANSTWYEVMIGIRPDTSVVDVWFTTTANRATPPNVAYTKKRRIGWVRRGTATNLQFTQVEDYFTLTTQINDGAFTASTTATALTLTVPPSCVARFRAGLRTSDDAAGGDEDATLVFSEIVEGNVTPAIGTGIVSLVADPGGTGADQTSGHFELRVSSSSQIEWDMAFGGTAGSSAADVSTFGWIDTRGRLA